MESEFARKLMTQFNVTSQNSTLLSMIMFLVQTKEEFNYVCEEVRNCGEDRIIQALIALRKKKIEENNIPKTAFLELFSSSKKRALELLFQEHINIHLIKLLEQKKITADQIYSIHMAKPYQTFARIVL